MSIDATLAEIRERVVALVTGFLGDCNERLMESGLLDSVSAIELGIMIENDFSLSESAGLRLADMRTVGDLCQRIRELQ